MVVRLCEVYASTQGEGPNVGRVTVFVRFGGCNLRCAGWPCDTQFAIDPQYRHEWTKEVEDDLFKRIVSVAEKAGARVITFTGGEPFLQPTRSLSLLTEALINRGYQIDCFSNGTIYYPPWAANRMRFIVDWKLPGSYEDPYNENRLVNLKNLSDRTPGRHAVKFVCKDLMDFNIARELYNRYIIPDRNGLRVYYGRVWDGNITNAELVEATMQHRLPWTLNVQVHNYIWEPHERAR